MNGADAVLLIVASIASDDTLTKMMAKSRALGMEPLVEVRK